MQRTYDFFFVGFVRESGLKPFLDLVGAILDVGNLTIPRIYVVEQIFDQSCASQLERLPLEAAG